MASQQSGRNAAQQFRLNKTYTTNEYKAQIRTCLEGKHQDSLPFPHFVFTNFVSNSALIANLRKELQNVAWVKKCNDLYSLNQTVDLGDVQAAHYPTLSSFRHFMITEVRQWLTTATGIQLSEDKLTITGSRYSSGDCLLPHDDRLEGRAFAFVLYLSNGWAETDGGALCLYDSDLVKNHPINVVKRIQPIENSLSLFRVQHNSWHSVEEVLSEKQRLSLNGWFHYAESAAIPSLGPGPTPEKPFVQIKPTMDITLAEVNAWLNADYVNRRQHNEIKRIFEIQSEISLKQFLNAARYNEALAELKTAEFEHCGPPNKRNVSQLVESKLAEGSVLRSLLRLFRSEVITLLLTQWTGLRLYDRNKKKTTTGHAKEGHVEGPPPEKKTKKIDETSSTAKKEEFEPSETTKTSNSTGEQHNGVKIVSYIYRFERGCYSMADDQMAADIKNMGHCLDLMLFFGRRAEWPSHIGGFTSFFGIGENREIMRVNPTMNTAAIVFREPEVMNFTKYVNHRAGADHFFALNCSFFGIYTGDSESDNSSELNEADELYEGEELADEGEDGNQ